MAPLKIGVIGYRMGRGHARAISQCRKTELVAVADLKPELGKEARTLYPDIEVFGDYKDLIEQSDADAVAIVLPVPLHYPATMAALKAGKHVVCEKPPANNARETKKMVDLAAKSGLQLTWGLQRRFLSEMHAARRAVAKGQLGSVYRVHGTYTHARIPIVFSDEFRMLKQGGGVFFDIGVHTLDMAWSLLGCPKPVRVVASNHTAFPAWYPVKKKSDMAEDNALALIFFDNGASVVVEVCYTSQRENPTGHTVNLRLLGDKGGLHVPSLALTTGGRDKVSTKTIKPLKSWSQAPHLQLYTNFADAVAGRDELVIKAEHGLALMKMIDAVIKSADEGREIKLK